MDDANLAEGWKLKAPGGSTVRHIGAGSGRLKAAFAEAALAEPAVRA
ncbi:MULTISPECIES: hypothetical protein [Haematobacter]|nr:MULTISPECIES: hypothetical protein [Haematobacter]